MRVSELLLWLTSTTSTWLHAAYSSPFARARVVARGTLASSFSTLILGSSFGIGQGAMASAVVKNGPGHVVDAGGNYYRKSDGVRITHDPYSPGMVEKYGAPGQTDNEGFDPYGDSVGPGIYGGRVKRDEHGNVVVGRQYQGHNPRPGPVYSGGGYWPIGEALKSVEQLTSLLDKYPDLWNDVTTGGASPLHMCGMSQRNAAATRILIQRGADVEQLETYGMTPLHRMASNNLGAAAKVLLEEGGWDPDNKGQIGITWRQMAQQSRASDVLKVLDQYEAAKAAGNRLPRGAWATKWNNGITGVSVLNAGAKVVNGEYTARSPVDIPKGFEAVCKQQGWDTWAMWKKLNAGRVWYEHADKSKWNPHAPYIYYNKGDSRWWLDGPDGLGLYIADGQSPHNPPGAGWKLLDAGKASGSKTVPTLLLKRTIAPTSPASTASVNSTRASEQGLDHMEN